MEKDFAIGLILGMIGGALIVANSYQARKMVKDGQEQIKNKVSEMSKKKCKSEEYEDYED
jgi:hypothetical protein